MKMDPSGRHPIEGGCVAGDGRTGAAAVSAWAPLGITVFRVLWLAQLGSNIGTWMQTVGAQWYLVDAAATATIVALVQTASLAPSLLLALPAGVFADSFDRRRLLIGGSIASGVIALALTAVSLLGWLTPAILLTFTFLLGAASALTGPAWQAIQPELVPREQIPAAAGLGGVTVNGARAIGPALAGFLVALAGTSVVFGLNALSFIGAAIALLWWKRPPQEGLDDREPFGDALRAGVRYVLAAGLVKRILLRSALFALPASGLWAVLPLIAQRRLGLDSGGYGLLLAALGVGALLGVFVLPAIRVRISDNAVLVGSALVYGAGSAGAAFLPFGWTLFLLVLTGMAWIGTLTVLNAALQLTLPQWVRARGAAVYIFVFMGTMAVGSFVWGLVAEALGSGGALVVTAIVLLLVAASVALWPLHENTGRIDRSISLAWPSPTLVFEPGPRDGPVTIMRSYRVNEAEQAGFVRAMRQVESSRRRTGASRWRLYRSGEEAEVLLETFVVPSWSEYRRQRTQRLTGRDREIEEEAYARASGPADERHYFPPGDEA
ncbi:MAG TPA: MFS transporter [Lacisediminihabitans sp.]|uniref:MFS transporter n=1 Tax=Lacisediminihabitans sp. TaxID=2787631 RepID=UPI002ED7CFDA